jgi:hypothetical protein
MPIVGDAVRRNAKPNAVTDLSLLAITKLPTSANAHTQSERASLARVAMIGKSYLSMTETMRE